MNILEYENYQEIKSHYKSNFSYNTYLCSIPLDFPSVPLHWHNEMELIYMKKGTGLISVDLQDYTVHSGNLLIILPGQLHSISPIDNVPIEYENIIFDINMLFPKQKNSLTEEFFNDLLSNSMNIPVLINEDVPYYAALITCIDNADTICTSFPNGYYLAIQSYLYQFFYILSSNLPESTVRHKSCSSLEKMKLITKYIEATYAEEITIKNMAELCDFSESHFMKFFKNNMGISFMNYLNDYRLLLSTRLLLSSSSTIIAIAAECGYDNLSYYNRLFKKKYKMAPSEFRKRST